MPGSQKISGVSGDYAGHFIRGQQKNGSYLDENKNESVFFTALVLCCLNDFAETEDIKEIKRKAADFLLSKKNNGWLFGDSVGVNFLAYAALMEYDPEIIDGAAIAKILMYLTSAEVKEGGPYYSEIPGKSGEAAPGGKIDPGVNAVIAYFLFLQDVELPELNKLIGSSIENSDFGSDLFTSFYPTIYFISKFYKGDKKEKLMHFILEKKDKAKGRLDIFFADMGRKNLEKKEIIAPPESGEEREEAIMMEAILKKAGKRFSSLNSEMKGLALEEIQKTIRGNRDRQMPLIAYYFKKSLGAKGSRISDEMIAEMGVANIFFWTAFIIYDDFWDEDEAADPRILPVANLYSRHYVDFFASALPEEAGWRAYFHELMDRLDEANSWETIHCKTEVDGAKVRIPEKMPDYGDYEFKYRPASGHILGPVALLVGLGYALDSAEIQNLILYFKNYLIAMQINDDAHDWEEDLRRGKLSTVAVMLLEDYRQKYPGAKEVDMDKDLQKLKEIFWFKTIITASRAALKHTDLSRQSLEAMAAIENIAPLERLIRINENVARKALDERKKTADFLEAYDPDQS